MVTRYIGIDYGEKRIGLALGDSESRIAVPFSNAANFNEVVKVINDEAVDEIVVGLPVSLNSENGQMMHVVDKFVAQLLAATGLPVKEIDERLTSKAADALLGKRDKGKRDAVAAMVILQSYLDTLS